MKGKIFKNFSSESFTHSYDAIPYTFEAGMEIMLEDFKADHFAKHLIDRELNRKGVLTNDKLARIEMEKFCFPSAVQTVEPLEASGVAVEATVKTKKGKKKVEEKEFADLDE